MDRLDLVRSNIDRANQTLGEVDTAMQESLELLTEAHALAIQGVGDTLSDDERRALAAVAESLTDRLVSVGNRQHLNTWLFAGQTAEQPFTRRLGGIYYAGDANRMETIVETDLSEAAFTIPGQEFYAATSGEVRGRVDLDPALRSNTRISDLNGALGRGVQLGRIVVALGTQQVEIDLTGAATAGDVVDRLNAGLPTGLVASLGPRGLVLSRLGGAVGRVSISDAGGGRAAADLGLAGAHDVLTIQGKDLDPRLTGLTNLADLRAGSGLDLSRGIVIRNGTATATIRLDDAKTVEDVLNRINHADVGVWARIGADGRTLDVVNRVSGTSMTIEENGGQAATALGLRSLYAGTRLAALNDGRGIETVAGNDLRITTADGTTFEVDVDGAETLQDVLDLITAAGGGAVSADLATTGNGIVITDQTAGGGTLTIEAVNSSLALRGLGLDVTASGNQLIGRDVNPIRVNSPFTALLEIGEGLRTGDRLLLTRAGERLDGVMRRMQEVQGTMAAQAAAMAERAERVEAEETATRILLSDVRDIDFTEAVVRFQQLQTALQANLATAGQVLNLSVLDYLR